MSTTDDDPVRSVMTGDVLGTVPSTPIDVALRMMVQAGVRHLPVIDGARCLGLLHESDVLWRLWSTNGAPPPSAADVARRPVTAVEVGDPARAAARRMVDRDTDAVLVVDDGRIVGIVTSADLVRSLAASPNPEG